MIGAIGADHSVWFVLARGTVFEVFENTLEHFAFFGASLVVCLEYTHVSDVSEHLCF